MQVVILCGGRGTRLNGERPKPLIEIGGRPIVWHVMSIYAAQGFDDFLLLTGYQSERSRSGRGRRRGAWSASTPAPTRRPAAACTASATGCDSAFCLTYADGLADIDLAALTARHAESGALATMTVVRPELPFGFAVLEGDRVTGFEEKPRAREWVNGGFFVLEPAALSYLTADSVLEREPLERLAADGALAAYRHTGYWRCLDTHKDAMALEREWASPRLGG